MAQVPHHLVSVSDADKPLDAAIFSQKATAIIEQLHSENKVVLLVGGSGFYLQALTEGMFPSSTTPKDIQEKSNQLYLTIP